MKKILIILLTFALLNPVFSQTTSRFNFEGKWQATYQGLQSTMIFVDNKRLMLTNLDGSQETCTYKIYFDKNPIWIDINMKHDTMTHFSQGLIKIKNSNIFYWFPSREGIRPLDYENFNLCYKRIK